MNSPCRSLESPRSRRPGALVAVLLLLFAACQSGPPLSLVDQGEAALSRGAFREADGYFERALAANPADPTALHGRAKVARIQRDPERALRYYGQISKVDRAYFRSATRDDYALALLDAGNDRLRRGKPASALQALRVLQHTKPGQKGAEDALSRALTAQAERLNMLGKRNEALAHYREAIGLTPHLAAPYVGAAEVLLASGQNKEALALLTDARKHNPSDNRVRALMVEAMGLY
jgi:tetratricopeptide (TPR) repeat protein